MTNRPSAQNCHRASANATVPRTVVTDGSTPRVQPKAVRQRSPVQRPKPCTPVWPGEPLGGGRSGTVCDRYPCCGRCCCSRRNTEAGDLASSHRHPVRDLVGIYRSDGRGIAAREQLDVDPFAQPVPDDVEQSRPQRFDPSDGGVGIVPIRRQVGVDDRVVADVHVQHALRQEPLWIDGLHKGCQRRPAGIFRDRRR